MPSSFKPLNYEPTYNPARLRWDMERERSKRYTHYWAERGYQLFPKDLFVRPQPIWLETGAGSGTFFGELARLHPEAFLIAVERCRMRAQRLLRKVQKTERPNFVGFRGNAIPAIMNGVPSGCIDRHYLMYPCPWPKNSQRKNRWYLHPLMPHLVRTLREGGLMIWASDQKFFIDEARYICESVYSLEVLVHGVITPNSINDLEAFPKGRTKFEEAFLGQGLPCYELIVQKSR